MNSNHIRIGFVGTRFSGTDGVSLETQKWASVLEAEGHECFYFAGMVDLPAERSYVVPEASFKHPEIARLTTALFDEYRRSPQTSASVVRLKDHLKGHLLRFVERFGIDLLIVENALSLPMNVPLGLALTEYLAESQKATIAHHHDFYWERRRYVRSAASDYLRAAFPPILPCIHNVVINSYAAAQLAMRTGATSTLIPNVMDFDRGPDRTAGDDYAQDLRATLGIGPDQAFILQPTRIVPRKRIQRAIELVRRLDEQAVLVISHSAGDEGMAYEGYLREYADLLGVRVAFAAEHFDASRRQAQDGRKIYSLADAYHCADLVTYPSVIEGFGNAFLEAVFYRKPIVMSHYEIYFTDIEPQGFRLIGFDDFIDDETVAQARRALSDPDFTAAMIEHNYTLGRRYYSYRVLEQKLHTLMSGYRDGH